MLQRIIGHTVGAVVAYLILALFGPPLATGADRNIYLVAVILGAVASFFWPIVIGFWLARRAKARRDNQIQDEVSRQVSEQTKNQ